MYSLSIIVMSKYLTFSLRFMPNILIANMKGEAGGLIGITVSAGSNKDYEVELHVMICILRV